MNTQQIPNAAEKEKHSHHRTGPVSGLILVAWCQESVQCHLPLDCAHHDGSVRNSVMPTKSSLRKAHTVEQFRVARVGMEGVIFRATDPKNYFAWFVFDGTVQLVKPLSAQHGPINRRGHVALLKEIFQTRLIE